MSPQKVYTIGVSNKFAAFGDESSSDEEGAGGATKAAKKEKHRSGAEKKVSSSSSAARTGAGTGNFTASKENRVADEPGGGNFESGNGPRAGGLRENGDRIIAFRGGRGGGDRGGFRGREGYRGGSGGFRRGGANVQRTGGFRDGDGANGGLVEVPGHDPRQRGERFGDSCSRGSRGGNRGGRGSGSSDRGGMNRNRRDFDRHSGTGRGPEMKKNGGGGHNWGNEEEDWGIAEVADKPQASLDLDELCQTENLKNDADQIWDADVNGVAPVEEEESPKEKEPEMLDLDAYRAEQRAKRMNLPQVMTVLKSGAKISTVKELEAQGYTKHVKRSEDEESEEEESSEEESDREDDRIDRKKKTMNVYEYIHNEGGRVRLFPGRRGGRGGGSKGSERRSPRGGGSGGLKSGGSREVAASFGSRRGRFLEGKDAPDIQDERAFPKLG